MTVRRPVWCAVDCVADRAAEATTLMTFGFISHISRPLNKSVTRQPPSTHDELAAPGTGLAYWPFFGWTRGTTGNGYVEPIGANVSSGSILLIRGLPAHSIIPSDQNRPQPVFRRNRDADGFGSPGYR